MQNLSITLGSATYTITPEGYSFPSNSLGAPCVLGVSYLSDTTGLYILGDTWIRNFVTTFDYV
jgi:hypothetical protein